MTNSTAPLASRYTTLSPNRDPFLRRARSCAMLTIPALMPADGHTGSSDLPTPFQSLGSRGLSNLASKLLLTLLPQDAPLAKLVVDWKKMPDLEADPLMRGEVEEALVVIEHAIRSEVEVSALRVPALEGIKQLLVSGNVLLFLPPEGGMRVFRLDRYCVKRDPMGKVIEIVVKESIHPVALSDVVKHACGVKPDADSQYKDVDVYTRVMRTPAGWDVSQEINGFVVPDSVGTYATDATPWLALRFTAVDNEDYGRGFIEEHFGDLKSLEALTQAIVEGSAAAAKVLFLVNPNGTTNRKTIAEAANGAVKAGNAADVTVLRMDKFNDFRVALETINGITERLAFAFMLQSAAQRNGERVTAEEIKYVAGELEQGLGGIYSILAQEFQLPLVRRIMLQLQKRKVIPVLPAGVITPTIVTGLAAMGRNNELRRLDEAVGRCVQVLGPEVAFQHINPELYIQQVGIGTGSKLKDILFTAEERAANAQQAQQQQAMALALPNATKGLMDNMNQPETAQ